MFTRRGGKMFIFWKDIYSVADEELDNQHKKLFAIYNELYDAQQKGISSGIIDVKLNELFEYTQYHFLSEEKLLEETGYEDLDSQKREHKFFEQHILGLKQSAKIGKIIITVKTLEYIKDWIITHILGSDKEYSLFLTSKKANN